MGWERLLTDAVYHNNLDEVKKYLAKDDVRRAIGRREWAEATAPLHKAGLARCFIIIRINLLSLASRPKSSSRLL